MEVTLETQVESVNLARNVSARGGTGIREMLLSHRNVGA